MGYDPDTNESNDQSEHGADPWYGYRDHERQRKEYAENHHSLGADDIEYLPQSHHVPRKDFAHILDTLSRCHFCRVALCIHVTPF